MFCHGITFLLAIVPVTVISSTVRQASTDLVPYHPTYNGVVLFKNTFDGQLPAADYPKVNVSLPGVVSTLNRRDLVAVLSLHVLRICIPCVWLGMAVLQAHIGLAAYPSTSIHFLRSQYREVSSLQYYLSGLVGFMVVEMAANWGEITFLGHPCFY